MVSIKFEQFDVWLINLNPTIGSEIKKTRPCVIISPNEMNCLKTIIVSPLTSNGFKAPTRINCKFNNIDGFVLLDQIRAVDKKRLIKNLGKVDTETQNKISNTLVEMFTLVD
jgi:mRNA interferase MazF